MVSLIREVLVSELKDSLLLVNGVLDELAILVKREGVIQVDA